MFIYRSNTEMRLLLCGLAYVPYRESDILTSFNSTLRDQRGGRQMLKNAKVKRAVTHAVSLFNDDQRQNSGLVRF